MKRNWQPEELIEHWTLLEAELALLTKKTASNRLGLALLLKFFQYEGRFPLSKAWTLDKKKHICVNITQMFSPVNLAQLV